MGSLWCDDEHHGRSCPRTQAIKAWLLERAKMSPPADCNTLFISERRKSLSRCTVWVMIDQVATAAGLEDLDIHPHMLPPLLRVQSREQGH
jgi:site-specific recombinase XerD